MKAKKSNVIETFGKNLVNQYLSIDKFNNNFSDMLFPPNSISIYNDINETEFKKKYKQYSWIRLRDLDEFKKLNILKFPEDYSNDKDIICNDVIQGDLGDCYLLSSLSAISEYPKRILNIIDNESSLEKGYFIINTYLNGILKKVVIDDYFPCFTEKINENGKYGISSLSFANINKSTMNIWPLLLEKVWAKLNGNYENIILGSCFEIFEIFFPCPFKTLYHEFELSNDIYNHLKEADKNKFIICADISCYSGGSEIKQNQILENVKNKGLIMNHAYSLIDLYEISDKFGQIIKLCKLRNPWGNFEWNGDWSDHSDKWTQELIEKVNFEKKDDGCFFMSFDDFIKFFTTSHICYYFDDYNFVSKTFDYLKEGNLQNLIEVSFDEDVEGYICINLKNERIYKNKKGILNFKNDFITINVVKIPLINSINVDEIGLNPDFNIINNTNGSKSRHFLNKYKFNKGKYYIYIQFPYYNENYLDLENENYNENVLNKTRYNHMKNKKLNVSVYIDKKFRIDRINTVNSEYENFGHLIDMITLRNINSTFSDKYTFEKEGEKYISRFVDLNKNRNCNGFITIINNSEATYIERIKIIEISGCYLKPIFFQSNHDLCENEIENKISYLQDKKERIFYDKLKEDLITSLNYENISDKKMLINYGIVNECFIDVNEREFDIVIPPKNMCLIKVIKFDENCKLDYSSKVGLIYPLYKLLNEVKFSNVSQTKVLKYKNQEVELYETITSNINGLIVKYKNKTNIDDIKLNLLINISFGQLTNLFINKSIHSSLGVANVEMNKCRVEIKPGEIHVLELRTIDPFIEYDYEMNVDVSINLFN